MCVCVCFFFLVAGGIVAVSLEPLQCPTPVVQVQSAFDAILES